MSDGQVLRSLLISSNKWVHRRVVTIDDTDPGRTKLRNSLDFTVPKNGMIAGSRDRVIIPIALLPKGVLQSWWVTDGAGNPLPVLNRARSTVMVRDMLSSALQIAGIQIPDSSVEKDRLLGFVDNGDNNGTLQPSDSAAALYAAYQEQLQDDSNGRIGFVKDLLAIVEHSWVVLVEVPSSVVAQHFIVKYGYDLPVTVKQLKIHQDNDSYVFPIHDPAFSRSLHFEVHVAPELEVYEFSLKHLNARQSRDRVIADVSHARCIAHLQNEIFIPRFGGAELWFRVRPTPYGIRKFTDAALIAVTTLVTLATIIRWSDSAWFLQDGWREQTTAAVILALPALLLSWIARTPETMGVARSFYRLRLINIMLATAMLLMAAALSTLWQPGVWHAIWWFASSCCIIAAWLRYHEYRHRKPTRYQSDDETKGAGQ